MLRILLRRHDERKLVRAKVPFLRLFIVTRVAVRLQKNGDRFRACSESPGRSSDDGEK